MVRKVSKFIWFLSLFSFAVLVSCRREFRRPNLENELLSPLAFTKLSINEIVPDSLQNTANDGAISLVYRNPLYSASLASFQKLETRDYEQTARLQNLTIGTRAFSKTITLGEIANATILGNAITHGNNQQILPIQNLNYGPITLNGSSFFQTVMLDSGFMEISVENQFPTGLENVRFVVRNLSDNSLVGTDTFDVLPPGETRTETINLAGKRIDGILLGNITKFDVTGTNGDSVVIDTNDVMILEVKFRDTKVNSATAIFPSQEVISIKDTTALQNAGDLRITKATAKTGFVDLRIISTLKDTIYFNYFVPEGRKDGLPLEREIAIAPNPNGVSEDTIGIRVDGYTFDLTGSPIISSYNAFYSELSGRIDSTGRIVNLSLQDSIRVFVKLRDFIPEYIEGYLGNNATEVGPESVPLNLFRSFYGGTLGFEEVEVEIAVENGNGVPFLVDVERLTAINNRTDNSVGVDLSALPTPFDIDAAASLSMPSESSWKLTTDNSNINDALNVFPNRMLVEMSLESNPGQASSNLNQFAVDSTTISAFADISIPLSLIAEDLIIADTVAFDSRNVENPEGILSGELYIICKNQFPFEGNIELTFLDRFGAELESISPQEQLKAGARGNAVESILKWPFVRSQLDHVLNAEQVVMRATMSTSDQNSYQTIYSDQEMNVTISSRFNYLYTNEN